ncbi:MAG: helicase-associated domain-containing protein [Chloroflexi bacterium]|nr:helicase-associated domain-containing protein [Chloroflexota bacterium]
MAMTQAPHRFDGYLESVRSDALKSMARVWGARGTTKREECAAVIRQGLQDPAQVRAALAALQPFERTALALAKWMGGTIDAGALAAGLAATGVPLPSARRSPDDNPSWLVEPLIRRGLFMGDHSIESAYYLGGGYGRAILFSDDRLLAQAGSLECRPFGLKAMAPSPSPMSRRPPAVILDIVGVLQAIETMGGVRLTQSGSVRVNDLRRLVRTLGWKEDELPGAGLPFPNPGLAFVSALRHSGLLVLQGETLLPAEPVSRLATRPYDEQARRVLGGFLQSPEWSEWPEGDEYGWEARRIRGRLALAMALAALPVESDGFFAVDALDQGLFERIGEYFSMGYLPHRPFAYNQTPEQVRQAEAQWRAKLREAWLARERRWLAVALSTWCYALGLVELGIEDGDPTSLRLTDLGRAVLFPERAGLPAMPAAPAQGAWIVQPNFDVLVYLDRASPEQLAFLERHTERVQVDQHVAQYRLTRESVYRGLESGTSPDDLVARLQGGAGPAVPQNVLFEIGEWAALREQITLRHRARLIELPDAQARQAAIQAKVPGTPVGERFLLLDPAAPADMGIDERVNYGSALPRCLVVTEGGVIRLAKRTGDLFIQPQIDRWAQRLPDGTWQLTAASVSAAVKAGLPATALFKLLESRLTHPLPPLLAVALRAWAGGPATVDLATVTILRCSQPTVFQAIAASSRFRPYLRGTLAPDVLLVETKAVEAVRAELKWLGADVSETVEVK